MFCILELIHGHKGKCGGRGSPLEGLQPVAYARGRGEIRPYPKGKREKKKGKGKKERKRRKKRKEKGEKKEKKRKRKNKENKIADNR